MANQFIGKAKFKVPKKPLNIAKKPGKGPGKKPGNGKTAAQKEAEKKEKLKKLSQILGAASDLTRGGDAYSGSSSNTDFGRAPVPTGYSEEDFWNSASTESGKVND